MHKFSLATAVAAVAIGSSASAHSQGGYVGLEGGLLFPRTTHVSGSISDGTTTYLANDLFGIKYKTGYDIDLIGGYDFGMLRLEGELGYKRAHLDRLSVSPTTLEAISGAIGSAVTSDDLKIRGHSRAFSGMVNGLVDLGGPGIKAYVGGGAGIADVKFGAEGESIGKTKFAWQLLAGIRTPVSDTIDFGLKYRYFRTAKLRFSDEFAVGDNLYTASATGRFSSHSLLASVVYNFGSRAPRAAARAAYTPAEASAVTDMQNCPDGTTVPLTSACPNTYTPPAPPPPSPLRRGERGQ